MARAHRGAPGFRPGGCGDPCEPRPLDASPRARAVLRGSDRGGRRHRGSGPFRLRHREARARGGPRPRRRVSRSDARGGRHPAPALAELGGHRRGVRRGQERVRARAGGRDRTPVRTRTEGAARHRGVGARRGGDPGRGVGSRRARRAPSEHRPRDRRHRHGALRRRPAHAHGVRLERRGRCPADDALAPLGAPPRHLRVARVAPAHRARSRACAATRRGAGGRARRCGLRRHRGGTAAPAGGASQGRHLR